ncbi:nucleoside triphosphate pyrophosphatase [Thiopseudomonas alkaliphila]|uniref:Maf family protein n=1 Tax=Thiopseudomonas alkaliphila TaxID=1697053 RepID=UPI003570B0B3
MTDLPIILASSSPYRQQLLQRLGLPFSAVAPAIDETPRPEEAPQQLVQRLALEKAEALAERFPQHLIIGSDQVCVRQQQILGKPHTHQAATVQLQAASDQELYFYTGLTVLNSATQQSLSDCVSTTVKFRPLSAAQIERYLQAEQPYDCAGSFKAEGLGISLFRYLRSDDPTALIGLPLIALTTLLQQLGQRLP